MWNISHASKGRNASFRTQEAEDVDMSNVIPSYVRARGPLALAAYRRELQSGTTLDKRAKILLIGQDRVGKTSLGKSLRGEQFNGFEPSTDGVEIMPAIKNASLQAWKNPAFVESESAFDHKCAELVTKNLLDSSRERSDSVRQFTAGRKNSGTEETKGGEAEAENTNDGRQEQKPEQIPKEVSKSTTPFQTAEGDTGEQNIEHLPENVASLIASIIERNDSSEDDSIWPVIWDFGGRAVYRAIHPIFLSQEAIYVLVLDLTRELTAPAQCRMRPPHGEEKEVASPDREDTNLDHILKWLDLVHSLHAATNLEETKGKPFEPSLPPVVLVGTHADMVRNPFKEMDAMCRTILKMAPPEILPHIRASYVIDNTKAGHPDQQGDSQIVSLRQKILELAKKMPHTKKEIPLQWLRVEEKIFEMLKSEVHYVIKKRFQEDIAEAICHFEDEGDVEELLQFLQARGTVIYHDPPKNPNGLVVLNPQWFINVLSMIITVNPIWEVSTLIEEQYLTLEENGLLSIELLNHAFEKLNLEGVRGNLLDVMEKFDLICDSRDCEGKDYPYIVPCILTETRMDTGSNDTENGPLLVFLTFGPNYMYVPSGLFCRLIVLFWKRISQFFIRTPALCANCARFKISDSYHLTLVAHKTVISLKLWTKGKSNQGEEKRLCKQLLSHLEHCRTRLQSTCQWLKSVSLELSVKCTLCKPCPNKCGEEPDICILHKQRGCDHFDCGHYIPLRSASEGCKFFTHDATVFCQEKLDPWTQALSEFEKGNVTDVIPPYVLARGALAVEAYHRSLQTGRTFDKRIKIFLIGQDRVGKTSLGKNLRGEQFNEDEPSTDGVKMMPAIKDAGPGAWRNPASLESTSAFDVKCAELVTENLRSSSLKGKDAGSDLGARRNSASLGSTSVVDPKDVELFIEELLSSSPEKSRSESAQSKKAKEESVVKEFGTEELTTESKATRSDTEEQNLEQIPGNVASLTEFKLKRNDSSKDDSIWPVLWDFAGQAVYRAIQPIFLSKEGIYLLVLDLKRELDAPAQCRVQPLDQGEVEVASPDTEDTNLDHILRWLDLIHSLQTTNSLDGMKKGAFPQVILVGTLADKVRNSGHDPQKEMKAVLDKILTMASRETVDHICGSFVIDNTKAGKPDQQEDPEIVSLRQKIIELAEKMPHTKKEVPLQWLRVEEKIYEMVEKGKHHLPKKDFSKVADAICHFNVKDDVEELLYFLQARGTVIYHDPPKNPDGLVVLDPQWLINVLNMIITVNPTWNAEPPIMRNYRILGDTGFLSNDLLDHAFESLNLKGLRKNLLQVMEKFNLICDSKGCKGSDLPYFVPCMLTLPRKDTTSKHNGPLPVFLTFNTKYVPSGLFCRLVALFWKWVSQMCGSCKAPTLNANAARFNVSRSYHLTLEAHKTVISIKLWTNGDSNQEEERTLCGQLLSHLKYCWTTLHSNFYWLESVSWEVSVQCTLCKPCPFKCLKKPDTCIWHKQQGCCHPDCGHYLELRDFVASCDHFCHDAPSFCKEKLDPWTQAFDSIEFKEDGARKREKSISAQNMQDSVVKCANAESSSGSPAAVPKKRTSLFTGISAKTMQHSIVKGTGAESPSRGPDTARKKRKRQFAGTSAQTVRYSTVRHRNKESSSGSPDAARKKKKRQFAVKKGVPRDEDLEWLSVEIADDWKPLGRRLEIKESKLKAFDLEDKKLSEKAYAMLLYWKQRKGSVAKFGDIYDALCHALVNRKDLAEKFVGAM